jgi:hypothetical protein
VCSTDDEPPLDEPPMAATPPDDPELLLDEPLQPFNATTNITKKLEFEIVRMETLRPPWAQDLNQLESVFNGSPMTARL